MSSRVSAVVLMAMSLTSVGMERTTVLAQQGDVGANPEADLLAGAIDFHVHSYPDAFGRSISDVDVAKLAARHGMRAIVLKNHVTMTADRAELVNLTVPEIEVFGGVVLNTTVGGLNPSAIEAMARMVGGRGKIVWLPTIDAQHYADRLGEGGKSILPGVGIRVVENGELVSEMTGVLEKVLEHDFILGTGHVSPEEGLEVIRAAREMGITKIIVTHAMARVPGYSLEQMKQAAELGAFIELVYLNDLMGPTASLEWMRHWDRVSIADMAAAVQEIGAEHFILSSDLGAAGLPVQPDGLGALVTGLEEAGIPRSDIDMMLRENPARLLGLEPE